MHVHRTLTGLAIALAAALAGTPARAQSAAPPRSLTIEFHADGAVTLQAQNVTPREIFAEWARKCGCYVVNADRLPGGPLPYPLAFTHEAQAKVLQSLLRPAAGYLLTPQRPGVTSASAYETIYILPTSTASAAASYTPAYVAPPTLTTPGSPDDEIPPVTPMPDAPARGVGPAPDPNAGRPSGPGVPTRFVPVPILPVGSSAPGTPTAAPGQPTPAPSTPATVRPAN